MFNTGDMLEIVKTGCKYKGYRARVINGDGAKLGFMLQPDGVYMFTGDGGLFYSCSDLKNVEPVKNPYPGTQPLSLTHRRRVAADAEFENYDFGACVEADNGWEWDSSSDTTSKIVFLADPDGGDSIARRFAVEFARNSCHVIDASDYKIP